MIPRPPISTHFPYTTLFRSRNRTVGPDQRVKPINDLAAHHAHRADLDYLADLHVLVGRLQVERHVALERGIEDRKSTRLNSSHRTISYAVFCLKKKNYKLN